MWQGLRLRAKNLSCSRGGRLIFAELNFAVESGQMVELRGPNGSGKSSLLRLIAGLNSCEDGALNFEPAPESISEVCHYVGHAEATKLALTVEQNIKFWTDFFQGNARTPLNSFRLANLANDKAALLSQGQRRRLALTRLVAVERPLWLLDEPSVGLDAATLLDLKISMQSHLARGGMIIAATHGELGLPDAHILNLKARS